MEQTLKNKRIAILVADGFNETHLMHIKTLMEDAGGQTVLISASTGTRVKSQQSDGGDEFFVDQMVSNVCAEDYDALLLPGGNESVQTLRSHEEAVQFVTDFLAQKRPIAALGEANKLLSMPGTNDAMTFIAGAATTSELEMAGHEILRIFAAAPMTETQKHTV